MALSSSSWEKQSKAMQYSVATAAEFRTECSQWGVFTTRSVVYDEESFSRVTKSIADINLRFLFWVFLFCVVVLFNWFCSLFSLPWNFVPHDVRWVIKWSLKDMFLEIGGTWPINFTLWRGRRCRMKACRSWTRWT